MIATSSQRVVRNTADEVNQRIQRETENSVAHYKSAGPQAIDRRLHELDSEWDVERYLETMAPTFTLLGTVLGLTVSRKWLIVPLVVQAFFLQHALQGWCPPLPVLRRLGIRTVEEITDERCALKASLRNEAERRESSSERTILEAVPPVHSK